MMKIEELKVYLVKFMQEPYPVEHEICVAAYTEEEATKKASIQILACVKGSCDSLTLENVCELDRRGKK